MISIITTIWKNDKFIDEALLSFIESCENIEFEILIGIDNCAISLNHLLSIYPKLSDNVRIFYFTEKVGTYIIRNTLSQIAKFENLIFFDSDDVMRKNTVKNVILALSGKYDFFRFGYIAFRGELKYSKKDNLDLPFSHHYGAFGIKKKVFSEMNGFEPWICAADGEFFWRLNENNYKIYNSNDVDILYRKHDNNLTSNHLTGMNSDLRKEYHKLKKIKIHHKLKKPLNQLTISNYLEVNKQNYEDFFKLIPKNKVFEFSIIIPTFNTPIYLEECLKSIINSIKNLDCEILVGVDNCQKTLDYLKNIKLDQRIKFYFFQKNVGPYVIKNSLLKITNSNYILFFDSDDIMDSNLIHDLLLYKTTHQLIKPMYLDFSYESVNIDYNIKKTKTYGEGVFAIDKQIFLDLNGFEPWKCAADSDFMKRLYNSKVRFMVTKNIGFYRRIHSNSLTQHVDTNYYSSIRNEYQRISKNKKNNYKLKKLHTEPFQEIIFDQHSNPILENFIFKREQINLLLTNVIKINPKSNNVEKKVDYDFINSIINKDNSYNPKLHVKTEKQNLPKDRKELIEIKKDSLTAQVIKMKSLKPTSKNLKPNVFGEKKGKRF